MSAHANPATVADCLRLGAGFSQNDRNWIVEQFAPLDARLAAFPADGTDLELMVKDRAARGQKVTLECHIPGQPRIVATSAEEALHDALNDVRNDLRRQLNDAKTRTEPGSNKHLRTTGPDAPAAPLDPEQLVD
ncbi:HPF/RaiA family ribosome-associated protein [Micromonospora echinofusca]|uniref:HPF/RaiA family ribosome-associated protein n=1 Tax=Micromonospora echinofusca TaxID=47858 RepID=A0ABS3VSU3_MICEH|nr:HPF/RaiA family ribosome-associated protein [Micromonospora echinofusca]MBO4207595.1 HPF/RaiA family ribosome-associated protein [Micromonospora echinofusca]